MSFLVGKFQSREIGENRTSRRSIIITQLYPINRNFTGSGYNIIAKLMLRCMVASTQPTRTTVYLKLFAVYRLQYNSPAPAGTSALSAGQTLCHASGGSSLA